jgi:hypothetical protein
MSDQSHSRLQRTLGYRAPSHAAHPSLAQLAIQDRTSLNRDELKTEADSEKFELHVEYKVRIGGDFRSEIRKMGNFCAVKNLMWLVNWSLILALHFIGMQKRNNNRNISTVLHPPEFSPLNYTLFLQNLYFLRVSVH